MSLAMYAAPFDNNENNEEVFQNKKKSSLAKTQKNRSKESFDTNKVNSVLEKIHNDSSMDDGDDSLGDFHSNFTPPSMPVSTVQKPPVTENMQNPNPNPNAQIQEILGKAPKPFYNAEENLDLNNFQSNYGNQKTAEDYYKKYIPHYNSNVNQTLQKVPYHNTPGYYANANENGFQTQAYSNMSNSYSGSSNSSPSQEALMQKLNYMIHLLEEQQDEKTNHVTEEVILYSFLGIFIIFIVDSFARVGKYVR